MGLFLGITWGALQNSGAQAPSQVIYTQEISSTSGSPPPGFKVTTALPLHLILQIDTVFMEKNQIIINRNLTTAHVYYPLHLKCPKLEKQRLL